MTLMDHGAIQDLLGAYALDALEADEAETVELHLRDCPRCRAEVADHRETAALLAFGGAEAPPGLWERIQASLEEPPPRLELGRVIPMREARSRRLGLRLAAAAAVVISLLSLGVAVTGQRGRARTVAEEIAAVAGEPGTRAVHLVAGTGSVRADVLLAGERGYLVKDSLPALDEGQTYQLWGQHGDTRVSVGVLGRDPGRLGFPVGGSYDNMAITVEQAGGAPQPTGPAVVAGWVPS